MHLLQASLMVILMNVLEKIVSVFGNKFFIFLWIALLAMMVVLLTIYPLYIAPLFNKFEHLDMTVEKEKLIMERIESLCKKFNFPLDKVFKIDGSK